VKPDKTSHIDKLSGLASDGEGPVFAQPWEAQLFAMVLELARQGVFSWAEWTKMLGVEIAAVRDRGEADSGVTYYRHWLVTLEQILSEKGVVQDQPGLSSQPARLYTQSKIKGLVSRAG
jgi:nitrile hydratase accessory protein